MDPVKDPQSVANFPPTKRDKDLYNNILGLTLRGISIASRVSRTPDHQSPATSTSTLFSVADTFINMGTGIPLYVASYPNLTGLRNSAKVDDKLSVFANAEKEHILFMNREAMTLYLKVVTPNSTTYFSAQDIYNKSPEFKNFQAAFANNTPFKGGKINKLVQGIMSIDSCKQEFKISLIPGKGPIQYCIRLANNPAAFKRIEVATRSKEMHNIGCTIL